ncbi:EDD, DegV family domain protein [Lactobacillus selangorensis]|uniref:EDD, DegV family domain protein n=1 Tax=Lactobacillus selangorensis TaxID=81857 RepID=A0A0R2G787_9LACO|nr:DegV family protein [Lactobacillus selangorensis]KRN29033.1 EDD, DegV family domain protein [Lactobacillus selangorensis]KRN32557.1 EDD, DegV family domain protein [Lactobacillus selangorensis]
MKTAVVTDSAAYLAPDLAQKYHITIVPITVIFGSKTYLEGVDITSDEFYDKLKNTVTLPTTSQITMTQMKDVYDRLAAEGYDEVISIHLSSGITTFFENLQAFVPSVKNIHVYPFDSKMASAGEADLALLAARLVQAGKTAAEIMPILAEFQKTLGVYFVVDDIRHLLRTGRISNSAAFVGNLLRIKPLLTFDADGKIVAIGKERTMKRAFKYIQTHFSDDIANVSYPVQATIVDGYNPIESKTWVDTIQTEHPNVRIETSHIGPVVGVHTGEKVMGMIWAADWQTFEG